MSYLLRKISREKWQANKGRKSSEFTADAITGCTRTNQNTLSVWQADEASFSSEQFYDLLAALATTMERPDAIDLLWLEHEWLINNGIEIVSTPGNSKYTKVNELHRDLSNLNHQKLGVIGQHIIDRLDDVNAIRITRGKLIDVVSKKLSEREFLLEDLSDKWQTVIKKNCIMG